MTGIDSYHNSTALLVVKKTNITSISDFWVENGLYRYIHTCYIDFFVSRLIRAVFFLVKTV